MVVFAVRVFACSVQYFIFWKDQRFSAFPFFIMLDPLFRKLNMDTSKQLTLLIGIMLVRALFEVIGSYDSELVPESLRTMSACIAWGNEEPWQCTVLELCKLMKLNLFATDKCTQIIRKVMEESEVRFVFIVVLRIANLNTKNRGSETASTPHR